MNRLFLNLRMAFAIAFFVPTLAFAQFLGLQSEVHAESDLGTTYRVYAAFENATDECVAVYSVGTAECVVNDEDDNCIQMGPLLLEVGVTTSFYQHPAGSNMGSDINPVFFSYFPEMEFDSWLTIGSSSSSDEAVSNIGMTADLAEFNAGSGFVMDGMVGGSWYVTPGTNPAAMAGLNGLVLLGQFTVALASDGSHGHVSCLFNIQWRDAQGVSYNEMGATLDTVDGMVTEGCMDSFACNYNVNANSDDGSCLYASGCDVCTGETDGSGTVIDNDSDDDGICDADEVAGCLISYACNYNAVATDADACLFATGCDECSGSPSDGTGTVVDNDADNDGVCDVDEVAGCLLAFACNYNAAATDPGVACVFPSGCESCSGETDGTGVPVTNDDDNDGVCNSDEIVGCQDSSACNYNAAATDGGEPCVYPVGCESCSGQTDGTGTVWTNDDDGDGICNADEILGCQDDLACNFHQDATDAATCVYPEGCESCSGETNGQGVILHNDSDSDGVCDADEIEGCQDPLACNYNALATNDSANCAYAFGCEFCSGATNGSGTVVDGDSDDDGVCDVDEVPGCQDVLACNYNEFATDHDGSCFYQILGYTCEGECLFDADSDGICDQWETVGCQDVNACNYDSSATDAGYCHYPLLPFNCDGVCINDADGDGICDEFEAETVGDSEGTGCLEVEQAFLEALANGTYCGEGTLWIPEISQCMPIELCVGDFDSDGLRGTSDLLIFLSYFGFTCE